MPPKLREIGIEIKESKELLELKDNWDNQSASAISKDVYNAGIGFLLDYSLFILNKVGVAIDTPEIDAGRNGNVFITWRTNKARLAISVEKAKSGEIIANYYGDLREDGQPIKGNVSVGKVSDFLAYWMRNLV